MLFIVLGYDLVEFLEVQSLVVVGFIVDEGWVQQFKNILIVDGIAWHAGQFLELVIIDVIIIVEVHMFEDCFDAFFGLHIANLRGDQLNKLIKINGFVLVSETVDDVVD